MTIVAHHSSADHRDEGLPIPRTLASTAFLDDDTMPTHPALFRDPVIETPPTEINIDRLRQIGLLLAFKANSLREAAERSRKQETWDGWATGTMTGVAENLDAFAAEIKAELAGK